MYEDPPWMDRAACAVVDVELFSPGRGVPVAPAKKVCADCPVRPECLAYALDEGIKFGVWGGASERERRKLRRQRREAAA